MASVTKDEAYKRYAIIYDWLNQGKGKDGLLYWEKQNCAARLDDYTRTRILGQNNTHNPTSFNEYLELIVPPALLLVTPGTN